MASNLDSFIRPQSAAELFGVKQGTLWSWLDPNNPRYLADFPKPVRLGKKAVGFSAKELAAYQSKLLAARESEVA